MQHLTVVQRCRSFL